jgi:L-Ala-D/L-Glu epimerase
VRIRRVDWITYSLPYVAPFATARGLATARRGLVIRLLVDDGLMGLGEASPVPGMGGGTLDQARNAMIKLAKRLVGVDLDRIDALLDERRVVARLQSVPSVACAFDTALCDLRAQVAGLSLAQLLSGECEEAVAVNATVGATVLGQAAAAARAAVEGGFRCVKLKVGMASSCSAELGRIGAVRDAIGPDVRLRLDANGAWSFAQAVEFIRAAERFDLELVEQPVAADDLVGLAKVRAAVGTPIAADESAGRFDQARRVVAAGAADILVVKPMLAGGPRPAQAIIDLAAAAGLQAFVTTTVDSGVGIAAALHVATTLPKPGLACGLATARLLAADLLSQPLSVNDGTMRLPTGPGLGVSLDQQELARYGDRWRQIGRC